MKLLAKAICCGERTPVHRTLLGLFLCFWLLPLYGFATNVRIPSFQLPTQPYAAIDLGPGQMIALDDAFNVAFLNSNGVYTWTSANPVATKLADYPNIPEMDIPLSDDLKGEGFQYGYLENPAPEALSAKGLVYVTNGLAFYNDGSSFYESGTYYQYALQGIWNASGFNQIYLGAEPGWQTVIQQGPDMYPYWVLDPSIDGCNENYFWGGNNIPGSWNSGSGEKNLNTYIAPTGGSAIPVGFFVAGVNDNGDVAGYGGELGAGLLTNDQQTFTAIGGGSAALWGLNDQDQVIGGEYGYGYDGFLWEMGQGGAQATTTLHDMLPILVQGQIIDVTPLLISNQKNPGTPPLANINTSFQILCNVMDSGSNEQILMKRDNAGNWTFGKMFLPQDISVDHWQTINSSGVFATLAKTNSVSTADEALLLLPFQINASIRSGTITVTIPDIDSGASGTLDVIFTNSDDNTQVDVSILQNQAPGKLSLSLDAILTSAQNVPAKPLDNQDGSVFDGVYCRWRVGSLNMTTGVAPFDVPSVEVLSKRTISNYYTPVWDNGSWGGSSSTIGVYPAGQFRGGLYDDTFKSTFLLAMCDLNEGLAMDGPDDGDTILRLQSKPAKPGFPQYTYQGTNYGYVCYPDSDQSEGVAITWLRSTSVAVRTNADRLALSDSVYVPNFGVRTVNNHGGLHGHTNQINVWLGRGTQSLKQKADTWGVQENITCLKIVNQ